MFTVEWDSQLHKRRHLNAGSLSLLSLSLLSDTLDEAPLEPHNPVARSSLAISIRPHSHSWSLNRKCGGESPVEYENLVLNLG